MGTEIRREAPDDAAQIARVHESAFEGAQESLLVDRLRADGDLVLSLVALRGGEVVGHAAFSRVLIDGGLPERAVALAPVAVLPEHRRQGVGFLLIDTGLLMLQARHERLVFVLGDPAYYKRFGFEAKAAQAFMSPWPGEAFQAKWLGAAPAGCGGVLHYAQAFSAFEE